MAIPDTQLTTWSKQGSVAQSSATYDAIKRVLEARDAPYANQDYSVFLQGSYGNSTNIFADSDVDTVIRQNSIFYPDLSELTEADLSVYNETFAGAEYSYEEFRVDVLKRLKSSFGSAVDPRNKAIFIAGSGSRRDADVLVAVLHRKFTRFSSYADHHYIEGIQFVTLNGNVIINFPNQHSENCTTKHRATSQRFKPMVRIVKNLRNRMVSDGLIREGLAPSYFLEGMLYNVPNENFASDLESRFVNCINWLQETDRSKLVCANEQYFLLHDSSLVTWRAAQCTEFLEAVVECWNKW